MNAKTVNAAVRVWTRKLHFYIGLYLILFLWLFSFSGLLLNHNDWDFAQFWPQRKVATTEQDVQLSDAETDIELGKKLMAQLGLTGEFEWTKRLPQEDSLQIRVDQPGKVVTATVNLTTGRASVETIRVNTWGVMRALHTFTGFHDPATQTRDWFPTILWSLSMDAVAFGTLFLTLTSVYMWLQLKPKRRPGLIALCVGVVGCAFFVFGLARLF